MLIEVNTHIPRNYPLNLGDEGMAEPIYRTFKTVASADAYIEDFTRKYLPLEARYQWKLLQRVKETRFVSETPARYSGTFTISYAVLRY
jgi:hypothetical protein